MKKLTLLSTSAMLAATTLAVFSPAQGYAQSFACQVKQGNVSSGYKTTYIARNGTTVNFLLGGKYVYYASTNINDAIIMSASQCSTICAQYAADWNAASGSWLRPICTSIAVSSTTAR